MSDGAPNPIKEHLRLAARDRARDDARTLERAREILREATRKLLDAGVARVLVDLLCEHFLDQHIEDLKALAARP